MTLGIPIVCFICFLALSSIAIFAPRRVPVAASPLIAAVESARTVAVAWPALVDPRAAGADGALRSALARELGTCDGSWAVATIATALAEEPDPAIAEALAEALRAIRERAAQA
jgi:hypothetical protein